MMRIVVFEGNTLQLIRRLSSDTRHRSSYEIDRVQRDKGPENWKPFPQLGGGVREICIQLDRQFE
jgi:phage-related protein